MTTPAPASMIADFETTIAAIMPTALDIIATIVDQPAMDLDAYERLVDVAAASGPPVVLALARAAAGLAYTLDLSGDAVRALAP